MMTKTILAVAAAMTAMCAQADAAVIQDNGSSFRVTTGKDAYTLTYYFRPVSGIAGQVTGIAIDYNGAVFPGIYEHTSGQVLALELRAGADIASTPTSSLGVFDAPISFSAVTAIVSLSSFGAYMSFYSLPLLAHADVPVNSLTVAGLTSGNILVDVQGFASVAFVYGTGSLLGDTYDSSYVSSGTLTLSVTYTSVPEPLGVSLLLAPMITLGFMRRR